MSGIAGVWNLQGQPVDPTQLTRMAEAARHRGPDGIRTWRDGEIGLAHLALNTTPESWREHQPCSNADGSCRITADARIDNRDELLHTFASLDIPLGEQTDVHLILAAYDLWGDDCPRHLIGDFAFVLYDRPRRQIVAARDRIGIRPLVYHHDPGGRFVWASEIKQLLAHEAVSRRINDAAVGDFLGSGCFARHDETAYRDILRLPPAHTLTIDGKGARLRRYWSLDDVQPIRYASEEDYASHFRNVLRGAVTRQTRSDRPFAIMMSGGLDSTAVASLAATSGNEGATRFTVFSTVFDELKECDERAGIEAVATTHHLKTLYVPSDDAWPLADDGRMLSGYDEPNPAPQYLLWDTALKAIRAEGCRVVLTGDGADAVCSESNLAYFNLLRQLQLRRFAHDVWSSWQLRGTRPALGLREGLFGIIAASVGQFHRREMGSAQEWLEPGFMRRVSFRSRYRKIGRFRRARVARAAGLADLTGPDQQMRNAVLDQAAYLNSLEMRHPFLDAKVLEFMFGVPLELFFDSALGSKPLLRRSMRGVLPEGVRTARRKVIFDALMNRGLRERGLPTARLLLSNPVVAEAGIVNAQRLRDAYERFVGNAAAGVGALWRALTAEIWLKEN
jgi:asparagine synthase (glutamine-hydrolysing)